MIKINLTNYKKDFFGKIGLKLVTSICFLLISLSIILIRNENVNGYESSIYKSIPMLVWIFLNICIFCGIIIVVINMYTFDREIQNNWFWGLIIIIFTNLIILSLPILKNYVFYGREDSMTHLGTVINIISSGHIKEDSVYPIAHIFIVELSYVLNINPMTLFKYVMVFFGFLYILFMHLLSKYVLPDKRQVILATLASTPLLHDWYVNLTPNSMANLIVPLILYIFLRSLNYTISHNKKQFKLLLLIMVFILPEFHPVTAFSVLFFFLTINLPIKIYNYIYKLNLSSRSNKSQIMILFVWTITWVSSFFVWSRFMRNLFTIMDEGKSTALGSLQEKMIFAMGYGYNPILQFLKLYSGITLYFVIALISLFFVLKKVNDKNYEKLISLYGPFATFIFLMLILFISNPPFSPLRLIIYVLIILTILTGFMFFKMIKYRNFSKLGGVCVVFIIYLVSLNGILIVYPSPFIYSPNQQATQIEIDGMNWFIHKKSTIIDAAYHQLSPYRFADIILIGEERIRRDLGYVGDKPNIPPFHFNYTNNEMLGYSYIKDYTYKNTYMVLNQFGRVLYIEVRPEVAEYRFYPSDYKKLDYDKSIERLYVNGELDIWYIENMGVKIE